MRSGSIFVRPGGRPPIGFRAMVPLHRFLEFAALSAAVIAVPGPSVLFTISRALT
jgi:hypothetical protein